MDSYSYWIVWEFPQVVSSSPTNPASLWYSLQGHSQWASRITIIMIVVMITTHNCKSQTLWYKSWSSQLCHHHNHHDHNHRDDNDNQNRAKEPDTLLLLTRTHTDPRGRRHSVAVKAFHNLIWKIIIMFTVSWYHDHSVAWSRWSWQ